MGELLEAIHNMENGDNNETGIVEKAGVGLFAIMLWCSTGGLMLIHIISVFAGATTWILASPKKPSFHVVNPVVLEIVPAAGGDINQL